MIVVQFMRLDVLAGLQPVLEYQGKTVSAAGYVNFPESEGKKQRLPSSVPFM